MAAGEFHGVVGRLLDTKLASLLLELPNSISASQRTALLTDYENARMHLTFTFALKLASMCTPPRLLYAAAHHNQIVARDALRQCLASASDHPAIKTLQSAEMRADAEEFLDGAELVDLEHLGPFVAARKFSFTIERMVEGEHARLHHGYARARNHTESFDSLLRRLPEIKAVMMRPSGLADLSRNMYDCRNPKKAIQHLGLESNPSLSETSHAWDKMFRKVLYRADHHSLFSKRATVHVGPPPAPPGPQQGPLALPPPLQDAPPVLDDQAPPLPPPALPPAPVPADAVEVPGHESADSAETETDVATASVDDVFKHHALHFLYPKVQELAEADRPFFGLKVQKAHFNAISQLKSLLSRPAAGKLAALEDDPEGERASTAPIATLGKRGVLHHKGDLKLLWFKIVCHHPVRAKRAEAGQLQSHDLGICVHKTLLMDPKDKSIVIEASSIHASHSSCVSDEIDAIPLVLSLDLISWTILRTLTSFKTAPTHRYVIDLHEDPTIPEPSPDCARHIHSALSSLVSEEGLHSSDMPEDDGGVGMMGLLRHYEAHGIVNENLGTWSLTTEGRRRLVLGHNLSAPAPVFRPEAGKPLADMTTLELMMILEQQGWTCVVTDNAGRKAAKKDPYKPGHSEKRWFVLASDLNFPSFYLLALAQLHGDDVSIPHFAKAETYKQLLGLELEHKKRKRRSKPVVLMPIPDDEWDLPPVEDRPKPKRKPRKPRAKKARVLPPAAPVVVDGARSDTDTKGSSSSSSSSSSRCGSSSSKSAGSGPGKPEDRATGDAGGGGGSSSNGQTPAYVTPHRRNPYVRTPFGSGWLTPKQSDDTTHSWQITCKHDGHISCNKTVSNSVSGSNDNTIRMLKYWFILGKPVKSKDDHKPFWTKVLDSLSAGTLPSHEFLDKQVADGGDPTDAPSTGDGGGTSVALDHADDHSALDWGPLGEPVAGIKKEQHERMTKLYMDGAIPQSTQAQRQRNKMTRGTDYGVPADLREALRLGYVHPDIGAPQGMRWRAHPNKYLLVPLGG